MDRSVVTMLDADIYVKTEAGRDEIKSRGRGLPMALRAILLMIDGQRTVGAMRAIVGGSKAPGDTLEILEAQGLIEPLGAPSPAPVAAPSVPARMPTPSTRPPPEMVEGEPSPTLLRSLAASSDLDLVLPTIFSPEVSAVPTPWDAPAVPPAAAPVAQEAAAPVENRYEHLYTMINEVVRDFLPAHRRLFIQLKIERCTTAEELLEMLHDLRTALAKSKGEAFASDVIARLRNAA